MKVMHSAICSKSRLENARNNSEVIQLVLKNNRGFRGHTAMNGLGHIDDVRGAWPNIIRSPLYWSNAAQVEPMRIYAEFTASLLGKGSIGEGSEEWRASVWVRRGEDRVGKSWGFPRGWRAEPSQVEHCRLTETQRGNWQPSPGMLGYWQDARGKGVGASSKQCCGEVRKI